MKVIKPPRLQKGDVIGIVAPSSSPRDLTLFENGIRYIEKNGFRVEVAKNISKSYGYLAGTDSERIQELHAMFANKNIKAIFVARGGYGLHRIIANFDFTLIKRNPKIIVGYSDVTALHIAVWKKCRIISLSAPLVVEFSEKLTGKQEEIFWQLLTSTKKMSISYDLNNDYCQSPFPRKTIVGRLLGGNLTLFSTLCGTSFFPSMKDSLFYFEDVGEEPYRIDRMLQQLKLAQVFRNANGIILGDFSGCDAKNKNSLTLRQIFSDVFSSEKYAVASGLNYGHCPDTLAIPFGTLAKLNFKKKKLELLENLVE
ncbi:MAG: LD-carboxypeptidase [Bacteroidota bacterium]